MEVEVTAQMRAGFADAQNGQHLGQRRHNSSWLWQGEVAMAWVWTTYSLASLADKIRSI